MSEKKLRPQVVTKGLRRRTVRDEYGKTITGRQVLLVSWWKASHPFACGFGAPRQRQTGAAVFPNTSLSVAMVAVHGVRGDPGPGPCLADLTRYAGAAETRGDFRSGEGGGVAAPGALQAKVGGV